MKDLSIPVSIGVVSRYSRQSKFIVLLLLLSVLLSSQLFVSALGPLNSLLVMVYVLLQLGTDPKSATYQALIFVDAVVVEDHTLGYSFLTLGMVGCIADRSDSTVITILESKMMGCLRFGR